MTESTPQAVYDRLVRAGHVREVRGIIEEVIQGYGAQPQAVRTSFAAAAEAGQPRPFAAAADFAAILRRQVQSVARFPWLFLPILCCQAFGGDPGQGQVVAAAFELARLAAGVLDDVEDGDVGSGPGTGCGDRRSASAQAPNRSQADDARREASLAVNAGTGLIFASLMVLNRLRDRDVAPEILARLQTEFARTGFRMCAGQHLDLVADADDDLSLERYWRIAEGKSGAFFELGCRAGALVGGASEAEIAPYADYGRHLGLLLQIVNDLGGLLDEDGGSDLVYGKKTLPLIYALSVAGGGEGERLRQAWGEAAGGGAHPYDAEARREIQRLVVELGAPQYTFVQAELHYRRALSALQEARGEPEALAGLTNLLDQYRPARPKERGT